MRILAIACFSFASALALAQYLLPVTFQPIAALIFMCVGLCGLFFRDRRRTAVLLTAFSLAAGMIWNWTYTRCFYEPALVLDGETVTVTAVAQDFPEMTDYGGRLDSVITAPDGTRARTLLYFYDDSCADITPGTEMTVSAAFSRADRMNGTETDSYTSRGYWLTGRKCEIISSSGGGFSLRWLHRYLARAIRGKISDIFPESASGFMRALLTGDRSLVPDELSAAMKRAGVFHVLAVSGLHVSVLTGFVLMFTGGHRRAIIFIMPVLVVFMAISGFTPSVVRAVVMQFFVLLARALRRDEDALTSLSAALFVLTVINPFAVKNVGLQLSFASMLGIIAVTERVYRFFYERMGRKKRRTPAGRLFLRIVASGIASSAGAMLFTMPLSAIYFGYVSLIAPLVNILVLWAVTLAFCAGAAAVVLGFIWTPLGTAAAFAASLPVVYISAVVKVLGASLYAALPMNDLAVVIWFLCTYGAAVILAVLKAPLRSFIAPACVSLTALCTILIVNSILPAASTGSGNFTAAVLDVGQGQSIVIVNGEYTAVIDCGSSSGESAGEITRNYLASIGRDSIDALVLTHFHSDHANGVSQLIGSVDVASLIVPPPEKSDGESATEIIELAKSGGADVIYVSEDLDVSLGDMTLSLFAPLGSQSENERCVCVLAREDDYEFLVTGDISEPVERMLVSHADLPDIEAMVVGHHGSKYSTGDDLLAAVTPETAVISVGANKYGHPAAETLERLADCGIDVYRTDESGTITVDRER